MTASLLVEPAFCSIPSYSKTLGPEVAGISELAGFIPDPEQRLALDAIFGMRPDNKVAALEAAVVAPRQNIKTGLFKQCVLGWLFVTDQRLIVWSAHEYSTAQEAHRDLAELLTGCDALRRRVKAIPTGNGDEGIELMTGQRVKFKARTKTGGRGLSGDKVVLDEAFALQPHHMGSLFPLLSVRPDPQVVYGSSAGLMTSGILRSIRDRGRPGTDPRLVYLEWCDDLGGECATGPNCDHRFGSVGCRLDDERRWYRGNTQLGRRMTLEYVRAERRALPPEEFGRERHGWWDEPEEVDPLLARWPALLDLTSKITGPKSFAVDRTPDLLWTTVTVAGPRQGNLTHLGVVRHDRGSAWVVDECARLHRDPGGVFVVDPKGPAASLIAPLREAGCQVVEISQEDYVRACADFVDAVSEGKVRHLDQPELDAAVAGAKPKPSGDGFKWDRKRGAVISPLVGATLALWRAKTGPSVYESRDLVVI